ncbi:retroviral-like aspartic protease family protein [Candidatus Poriferisodalis sp.]|uniref:retroviral-like aspartic protease family protein n=1 Tax=Candidatus Poriferisodalis sp. TaxID=3101277 RepID=UPI003B028672
MHQLNGRPLPPAVRGIGLVDTGTVMSLIDRATAAALALDVLHSVELHTATGSTTAPCYAVEFSLVTTAGTRTRPLSLVVARAPNLRENMVIGLHVLRRCRAEWDGPAGTLRLWPVDGPRAQN